MRLHQVFVSADAPTSPQFWQLAVMYGLTLPHNSAFLRCRLMRHVRYDDVAM